LAAAPRPAQRRTRGTRQTVSLVVRLSASSWLVRLAGPPTRMASRGTPTMDLEIVGDARDARDALNDPFEDLTLHRGTDASEQRDEALGDRDARGRHVHLRLPFDCGEDAILQE